MGHTWQQSQQGCEEEARRRGALEAALQERRGGDAGRRRLSVLTVISKRRPALRGERLTHRSQGSRPLLVESTWFLSWTGSLRAICTEKTRVQGLLSVIPQETSDPRHTLHATCVPHAQHMHAPGSAPHGAETANNRILSAFLTFKFYMNL